MEKIIYIVRHCQATGQSENAPLTATGHLQANELVKFFKMRQIDRIISSPFVRAQETIQPLAEQRKLEIELDSRLGERVLSSENLVDWQEKLAATFKDPHLTLTGGESSAQAMKRIKSVVDKVQEKSPTILVTHGNIMALLLREYNPDFGFDEWKMLTNPDIYLLKISKSNFSVKRLWREG